MQATKLRLTGLRLGGFLSLIIASCATWMPPIRAGCSNCDPKVAREAIEGLKFLQTLDQRVANISWRLATTNREICPTQRGWTGISLHTVSQYDMTVRAFAQSAFGFFEDFPSVLAIAEGSAASRATLRVGDSLLELNGHPLGNSRQNASPQEPQNRLQVVDATTSPSRSHRPKPKKAGSYEETSTALVALEALPARVPAQLLILRAGKEMAFTVVPDAGCVSRVEITPGNSLNANANGRDVQISGRIVLETPDDNELALLIGHEMAHNILVSRDSSQQGRAGLRWSRKTELQADRFGIFMAARAGYDVSGAEVFWRRMAQSPGIAAWLATTHPRPDRRAAHARAVATEVRALIAKGVTPVP